MTGTGMGPLSNTARWISPAILVRAARWARDKARTWRLGLPEWEYVPEGWERQKVDPLIKGWNVAGVLESYKAKWPLFVKALEGSSPLGISHEATAITTADYSPHNTLMAYAYVLALAARKKEAVSILDWGGGIGHYYLISKAVLPDVEILYHCKDLPILCGHGRELFPEAQFYEDESFLERRYDLVLVSTSLQYSEEWSRVLRQLASVAEDYLFVTRLPVVFHNPSFVVLQRAYQYGYDTEYLGWFLNRDDFLRCAVDAGMRLIREFLIMERPFVRGAPEQGEYRGFLFEPAPRTEEADTAS
jgi:putative methyltransferase (TIGR04325 family)